MNVVLLEPDEIQADRATIAGDRARHVREVLGAQPGATLRIGVVGGPLGTAEILAVAADSVTLACRLEASAPTRPRIDLVLAMPRPKVLARLWSPLAQLGVDRILLTNAWKVERYYFDAHVLDEREHRPKLLEGLAQARDTQLPRVSVHRSFAFLLEQELDALVPARALRLHADPATDLALEAPIRAAAPARLVLAIGPEGGFTPRELALLEARGFAGVGLGRRILRSDVATIALLARAHAALDVTQGA